jgi:hypothetical protein
MEVLPFAAAIAFVGEQGAHQYFAHRRRLIAEGRGDEILWSMHTMDKIRESSPFRKQPAEETTYDVFDPIPEMKEDIVDEADELKQELEIAKQIQQQIKKPAKRLSFNTINPQKIKENVTNYITKRFSTPEKVVHFVEDVKDIASLATGNKNWMEFVMKLITFIMHEQRFISEAQTDDHLYQTHKIYTEKLIKSLGAQTENTGSVERVQRRIERVQRKKK